MRTFLSVVSQLERGLDDGSVVLSTTKAGDFRPGDCVMIDGKIHRIYKVKPNAIVVNPNWLQRRLLACRILFRRLASWARRLA